MHIILKVGDLVRTTHAHRIGIVVQFYDNGLYSVMFENGKTYTCFLQDLERL